MSVRRRYLFLACLQTPLGLLYPVGPTVVEFTPGGDPVTLQVGIGDSDRRQYFRSLRWFVNSEEISSTGKYIISEDGTNITITDIVDGDAGVYEAKFTGLAVTNDYYNEECESEALDLLRRYPIAEPVSFTLIKEGELLMHWHALFKIVILMVVLSGDEPSPACQDQTEEISFVIPFGENITSVFSWIVSSDRKPHYSYIDWQFNGIYSQTYILGGLVTDIYGFSQTIDINQASILDEGYLDGALRLYIPDYFSNEGCSNYYSLIDTIFDYYYSYYITLEDISLQIQVYGKSLSRSIFLFFSFFSHHSYSNTDPPKVQAHASSTIITDIQSSILNCSASEGYPPLYLASWVKGGVTIAMGTDNITLNTTDVPVARRYGEYSCVVNNTRVTAEKTVFIREKGNPPPPPLPKT